jgi:type II secretory pathway pseudopilin PulG
MSIHTKKRDCSSKGFMLIEVTLVILLMAVILGPLLHLLANQRQKNQVQEQLQIKQKITEAVEGFILATGRLPCPALQLKGLESRVGDGCTQKEGWLPVATLNTWGIPPHWKVAVATLEQAGEPAHNALVSNQPFAQLSPQQLSEIILAPYTTNLPLGSGPLPAIHLCQTIQGQNLPLNTSAGCGSHTLLSASAVWVAYPVEEHFTSETNNLNQNRYQQFFINPDLPTFNPVWLSFERMNWLWMKRGSLTSISTQEN